MRDATEAPSNVLGTVVTLRIEAPIYEGADVRQVTRCFQMQRILLQVFTSNLISFMLELDVQSFLL